MEIQKVPRPDYRPVEYAAFRMNPGRNQGEVLLGYRKDKDIPIPVYFRRDALLNIEDWSAWTIRTFRVELPYHFESVDLLGSEKRMIYDYPILKPHGSAFYSPDSNMSDGGRQAIILEWAQLDQKVVSQEELLDLLGL